MKMNRHTPLRIGAVPLLCVFGAGCGAKSLSLSEPNDAQSQDATSKAAASGLVKATRQQSPYRLTSSEGTELRMTRLEVKGVVIGPLAFTELHFTFKNAEPRVVEGRFRVVIPETASISRFAMKTSAGWQEGEMVEKTRARTVYEDFLHRRQDPALLEKALGNEFSARVFPIAANEEKHLILAYSEELLGSSQYTVALAGLPTLEQLDVDVSVNGPRPTQVKFERKGMAPGEDLVVGAAADQANTALRNGDLAVIRVRPKLDEQAVPLGSTMVLVDTSASRSSGFAKQLVVLEQLAHRVAREPNTSLTVAAFDQTRELMYQGRSSGFDRGVLDRIAHRGAMGATDVLGAIAWARNEARLHPVQRLIVVTDGVTTMHDIDSDPIVPMVRALHEVGVERLDVVVSGGIRDSEAARGWTNQLPMPGVVLDAELPFATLERRLTHRTSGRLAVDVEGASWFSPTELDSMQNGDEALVYAEVTPNRTVALRVGGQPTRLRSSQLADRALLERAWARAKISDLVERQKQDRDNQQLARQIVELSQHFRVISPLTALLVLETDDDYQRFSVKRDSNVLQIKNGQVVAMAADDEPTRAASTLPREPHGKYAVKGPTDTRADALEQARRFGSIGLLGAGVQPSEPSPSNAATAPWGRDASISDVASARGNLWGDAIGDAAGSGGLGLAGTGEGIGLAPIGTVGHGASATGNGQANGLGSGSGRLAASHRTRAPVVRIGKTEVSGRLPPEVIQRIVRQNYGRFRMCYEQGLARDPRLNGRVSVRFVIGRGGEVSNATNAGSSLPDSAVVACVINAFYSLNFPIPEGGIVRATYPITFELGGGVSSPSNKVVASSAQPERYDEPWDGRFADVMAEINAKRFELAVARAQQWRDDRPSDLLAWVALGRAYRAQGERDKAARALGSIIDLWGFRADLRRFAAGELEALHSTDYLEIAIDSYRHALADRSDHPSSRLWLAVALMKQGELAEAMKILEAGQRQNYAARYLGSKRIFGELLQLCAAAQIRRSPQNAALCSASASRSWGSMLPMHRARVFCSLGKRTPTTSTSTCSTRQARWPTTAHQCCQVEVASSMPTLRTDTARNALGSTARANAVIGATRSMLTTSGVARWAQA